MLRLFGSLGFLTLLSAALALTTGSYFFRGATLAAGGVMCLLYYWLQRSLPPRRGTLRVPGLKEPVDIFRDDRGVPHIYARNSHDLYLAQGYVTAQDRLWSMDLSRRAATGTMAELFGQNLLELDKLFRAFGFRQAAEASWPAYAGKTREALEAYAQGVNARISEGKLPPEFGVLRYKPEPWSPVDCLVVFKYMARETGAHWPGQMFRAKLVQTVGAERAVELFPTSPDVEQLAGLEDLPLPEVDHLLSLAAEFVTEVSGGHSWVVSGAKTRSGAPILACAPNLPIRNPALWYQTHLVGPGRTVDVTGAAFPGVPGIISGHNHEIAWGVDVCDGDQTLYVERARPGSPLEFEYIGAWEPAQVRREEIWVRGAAQPVLFDVAVTRHGPVLSRTDHSALALRWTALESSTELDSFLGINTAHSWSEFQQAIQQQGRPSCDFIFAGKDGTIASRRSGAMSLDKGRESQVPVPGWIGISEQRDHDLWDRLHEVSNPPEGLILAGTQTSYQALRVIERLAVASELTVEKVQELQTDRVSLQARTLLQTLLHAVQEGLRQGAYPEPLNPIEKKALLILSGWEFEEGGDLPAPLIWHQWYLFLVEGIFRPAMGLTLFDQFVSCGQPVEITDRLIRRVAEGGNSEWLFREGEAGLPRQALRAFRRAVAYLRAKYGPHPDSWRWDREHRVTFSHWLTNAYPILRHVLQVGPASVCGSGTTLWANGYSQLRPFSVAAAATWRQVVDLGLPDGARDVCAPGQSGNPISPYYEDQFPIWLKAESAPSLTRHDEIRNLPHLVLEPAPGNPAG